LLKAWHHLISRSLSWGSKAHKKTSELRIYLLETLYIADSITAVFTKIYTTAKSVHHSVAAQLDVANGIIWDR